MTIPPVCPDDGQLIYRTRRGARRAAVRMTDALASSLIGGRYVAVRCPVARHWHTTYTAEEVRRA